MAIDPIKDGLNWYCYTSNNPIKYIDPTGLYYLIYDSIKDNFTIRPHGASDVGRDATFSFVPFVGGAIVRGIHRLEGAQSGVGNLADLVTTMPSLSIDSFTTAMSYFSTLECLTDAAKESLRKGAIVLSIMSAAYTGYDSFQKKYIDDIAFKLLDNAGIRTTSNDAQSLIDIMDGTLKYILEKEKAYFMEPLENSFRHLFQYRVGAEIRDYNPINQGGMGISIYSLYDFDNGVINRHNVTKESFLYKIRAFTSFPGSPQYISENQRPENAFKEISGGSKVRYDQKMKSGFRAYWGI